MTFLIPNILCCCRLLLTFYTQAHRITFNSSNILYFFPHQGLVICHSLCIILLLPIYFILPILSSLAHIPLHCEIVPFYALSLHPVFLLYCIDPNFNGCFSAIMEAGTVSHIHLHISSI